MKFDPKKTFKTLNTLNALQFMLDSAVRLRMAGDVRAWSEALVIMKNAEAETTCKHEKHVIALMVCSLENWMQYAQVMEFHVAGVEVIA